MPRNEANLSQLEVELQYGHANKYESERVNSLERNIMTNTQGDLLLGPIIKHLVELNYPIANTMISYFSAQREKFVFVGNDPLPPSAAIPVRDITFPLQIKCRYNTRLDPTSLNNYQTQFDDDDASDKGGKGGRRTKERKIGYIIEKVARWRNLYNGVTNSKGETVRLTLEEAALQVSISKKSLDDYLLQLRFGRKFGFNFEEHKNDKVGLLRAYVKKYKTIQSELAKLPMGSEIPREIAEQLSQKGTPSCKNRRCCVPPPGVLKMPQQFSSDQRFS